MSSTPRRRPATTSSRLASMNAATSCAGGRAPPRRNCAARFRISLARLQLTVLLLERLHPRRVARAHPGHVALVDVGLAHPGPHRLGAVPELRRDPLDRAVLGAQLGTQRPDHPHRSGLLLRAVATRRRLPRRGVLRHESILVSKRWRLQPTQCDSDPRDVRRRNVGS